ncbi:MAG: copper resistance protein NlpE N-terminal domain-containing protein [Endomicrobia bacterium]|nr:copper resistance protein NlpE N-terminal domain-containing protein [Endomicrobiia bacterium]MCL2799979.1 copper resistance protein NlpE N-terminal domain-containing protein [Endomicrobiia bacterium]
MKKIKFCLLFLLLAQFFISGCMLKRIPREERPVSKETVKDIESKAYDSSRAVSLNFNETSGYYLRNAVKLPRETNFFVAHSQKKFDEYLGKSSLNANTGANIDFKKSVAAIIILKPSSTVYDIKINNVYSVGSDIYLDYEISSKGISDTGYFVPGIKILEIEKPQIVTNVAFIDENRKIFIIPFGNRNIYSPSSVQDLKKYYTGMYKGTIPAADGPGITVHLNLIADNTFILKQSYIDRSDKVFESSGNWAPTEDLSSFVLNYDKDSEEQMRFYFIDRNTIEKLDIYGERIKSEFYKLKK